MKRFLTAIIAMLFLVSATGTTVHLHYCMGKLVSASHRAPTAKHKCARCGMTVDSQKNKGCCKDETRTIKSSEQQKTIGIDFVSSLKVFIAESPQYFSFTQYFIHTAVSKQLFLAHAPPERLEHCPIFLKMRNIRI